MLSVSVRVGPWVDAAPREGAGRSAVARPPSDISPLRCRHPNLTATGASEPSTLLMAVPPSCRRVILKNKRALRDRQKYYYKFKFTIDKTRKLCYSPACRCNRTPQALSFLSHPCKPSIIKRLRTLLRNGNQLSPLISVSSAHFLSQQPWGGCTVTNVMPT